MRRDTIARWIARAAIACCVSGGAGLAWAADGAPPADGTAPAVAPTTEATAPLANRIVGLRYQFTRAQREAYAAYATSQGKPDEERIKIYQEKSPKPLPFAQKAMAWAEQEPHDPATINALLFVVELTRSGEPGAVRLRDQAIEMLRRDHLNDPDLGQAFATLAWQHSEGGDKLMQLAAEKSTSRDVRGSALYWEAMGLKSGSEQTGNEKDLDSARKLFQQVAADYADVKGPEGALGEAAKTNLYEIDHLAVGKTAPEIEGKNQDDKPMKLSDYRGKVVVLDFWGDW